MTRNEALMYAAAMTTLTAIGPMMLTHYAAECQNLSYKVRISICDLVYRKALRLSQASLAHTSPGKLVNLVSTDVYRFDEPARTVVWVWCAPIFTIFIMYFLWQEIQWVSLIGLVGHASRWPPRTR